MTEAEFNTCTDPEAMLAFLEGLPGLLPFPLRR